MSCLCGTYVSLNASNVWKSWLFLHLKTEVCLCFVTIMTTRCTTTESTGPSTSHSGQLTTLFWPPAGLSSAQASYAKARSSCNKFILTHTPSNHPENFYLRAKERPELWPSSLSNNLTVSDIRGLSVRHQPVFDGTSRESFQTNRHLDPLNPQYSLPGCNTFAIRSGLRHESPVRRTRSGSLDVRYVREDTCPCDKAILYTNRFKSCRLGYYPPLLNPHTSYQCPTVCTASCVSVTEARNSVHRFHDTRTCWDITSSSAPLTICAFLTRQVSVYHITVSNHQGSELLLCFQHRSFVRHVFSCRLGNNKLFFSVFS